MNKKIKFSLHLCLLLFILNSCSQSAYNELVGNGRDEHGCLTSAGYQWSYAKNDCIRTWEAGTRLESPKETIFVVFSKDSVFAEIFASKHKSILCKRTKNKNEWTPAKGKERVSISNGVINVYYNHYNFTTPVK